MDKLVSIGDNRPEDVRWLLSLSEPELDLVISLKELALQRAKVVGHENLAYKFDLKILRALSSVVCRLHFVATCPRPN
ncbi:uncharacterized protein LOC141611773 isoform X2 [Silene latifolia]|uniref:uncharacterized protein LOC141611773 isoform X2 n=1 Tax=Silene latifolia TaxID=37657 RepID=UPI003D76E99D